MKKITKKEIRKLISDAVRKVNLKLKAPIPGKKAEKLLDDFSRKYASDLKKAIKKNVSKSATRPPTKRKLPRKQPKI